MKWTGSSHKTRTLREIKSYYRKLPRRTLKVFSPGLEKADNRIFKIDGYIENCPSQENTPDGTGNEDHTMNMNKLSAAIVFVAGAALSSQALASEDAAQQDSSMLEAEAEFVAMDADKDGNLSPEEAAAIDAGLEADFQTADVDQSGGISQEEYILYSGDATAAGGDQ